MKRYAFYISGKSGRLQKYCLQASVERIKSIALVISDAPFDEELKEVLKSNNILFEEFDYKNAVGTRKEKNRELSNFMLKRFLEEEIEELNIALLEEEYKSKK